jgi:hypothetical protein
MLYWRAGVFITDNETLARTLEGISEGHFWIEPVTDEATFNGPGAEIRDGYVYGRNYGQLLLSLPVLWLLELLSIVVELRVGLIALWHLLTLALAVQLGELFDRREEFAMAGSILVFSSFIVNLLFATQFVGLRLELLALQLTSLLATGFVAVVLYRLVTFKRDRRSGALVGAASVFVLPVGFWATIPKRHVFTALVVVLVLYLFARSRTDTGIAVPYLGPAPVFRACMYVAVGFLTWIHAAEGLFVFLALVAVDIPTAPTNDRRTLAFVGVLFVVSMLPTIATNFFVTGDPLRPPRTLGGSGITTPAAVEDVEKAQSISETSDSGTSSTPGRSGGSGDENTLVPHFLIDAIVSTPLWWFLSVVMGIISSSFAVLTDGERLINVFLRSGSAEITTGKVEFRAVNLSVLESLPLLGAGVAIAAATWWRSLVSTYRESSLRVEPRRTLRGLDATGVLAAALIVSFVLLYLSKLPLHVQITQRYILPIYPLALYLLTHSATLRKLVAERIRPLLWSYFAVTLLGTQLFLTYVVLENLTVAEASRVNATLSIVAAIAVTLAVFVYAVTDRLQRLAAITLGVACASGTVFLVVSGVHYFSHIGQFVLPLVEFVSDLLAPYR